MEEFGAHMAAARAGCPICKAPLDDLRAEHSETWWKNRCLNPNCPGVREYCITYEVQGRALAPAPRGSTKFSERSAPREEGVKAVDGWSYCDDYNRWTDIRGIVVKLKELSNEELLDAIYALKEANFSKTGSHTAWVKGLPRKPGKCLYPRDALAVGKDVALAKLEEMQDVATERSLFGTST